MRPKFLACRSIEANQGLGVIVLLLREQLAIDDDHRRPRGPHFFLPDQRRRRLLPIGADFQIRHFAIASRPTKQRPIARLQRQLCRRGFGRQRSFFHFLRTLRQKCVFFARGPTPMHIGNQVAVQTVGADQRAGYPRQQHRDQQHRLSGIRKEQPAQHQAGGPQP